MGEAKKPVRHYLLLQEKGVPYTSIYRTIAVADYAIPLLAPLWFIFFAAELSAYSRKYSEYIKRGEQAARGAERSRAAYTPTIYILGRGWGSNFFIVY